MRIFISYRRDDSAGSAGRLYDTLSAAFGHDQVFRDVADIAPGVEFRHAITTAVAKSDVFIVVIGSRWLDARDGGGKRRLEDPDDVLRVEVGTALARGLHVIPALVDGGRIPSAGDLPDELRSLAFRNAVEIRDWAWEDDCRRLVRAIKRLRPSIRQRLLALAPPRRIAIASVVATAAAAAALVATSLLPGVRSSVWQPPVEPVRARPASINAWIRTTKLEGINLDEASVKIREKMERALLRIRKLSKRTEKMQLLDDEQVIQELLSAGCPDKAKAFEIQPCARKIAIEKLGIGAEVHPTFRSKEKVGSITLVLRIVGDKGGTMDLPEQEMRAASYDALADWAALQIATALGVKEKQIAVALEKNRRLRKQLEGGLLLGASQTKPGPSPGANLWPSIIRVAAAADPSPQIEQQIRQLMDKLESALESRKPEQVAPLFASMPSQQQAALQQYFDNIDPPLRVTFSDLDITVSADTARVALLREDAFTDKDTREPTSLAIRLVAELVRRDGAWRVVSFQKPS